MTCSSLKTCDFNICHQFKCPINIPSERPEAWNNAAVQPRNIPHQQQQSSPPQAGGVGDAGKPATSHAQARSNIDYHSLSISPEGQVIFTLIRVFESLPPVSQHLKQTLHEMHIARSIWHRDVQGQAFQSETSGD